MNAKVLSLNTDKSMSFARFQARMASSIKAYTEDEVQIQQFEDIREIFVALQSALENDGLVITAVDTRNYLRFKNALIQAFGTEVTYNPTILNKIDGLDMDDKKKRAFSVFPKPATIFLSDDGLYSGFGMENGEQYLVLLPIDNNRIDGILRNGLVPFLNKKAPVTQAFFEYNEVKNANNEKVDNTVKQLKASNSMVAINGTRNAEILKSCGDSVAGFNDVFVFTPHVEDKGNVNATEYTAQLAKVSLDLSPANIGACISDIYFAGDVKYICISVASGESAIVRKLYMSAGETEDEFVESAAIELIELIGEKSVGKRSIGIEITDDQVGENIITEKEKKAVGNKPLAIIAVVLGVIIIVCSIIAVLFNINGGDLFNKEEATTESTTAPTEPSTQNFEINKPVEPNVDRSLMKFSDYVVSTLLSMTDEQIAQNCVITDKTAPEFITVNGEQIEAREAIARLVTAELGSGYKPDAVKAQAIVIYTSLKFLNNDYTITGIQIADSYNENVKSAVDEVFGQYLTYNGVLAITPYHLASPTMTLDMSSKLPYLTAVEVEGDPDVSINNYIQRKKINPEELKTMLLSKNNSFVLSENPKDWIVIKAHDGAVDEKTGNVLTIVVGGIEMTGLEFKLNIAGDELASLAFTLEYNENDGVFELVTYGSGYTVGMSQTGANVMAVKNDNVDKKPEFYKEILSTYYVGTELAKEDNV